MHSVKILDIADVTHNVRRYTLEKPPGYSFKPGQATEVSLDEEGWRDKKHPFTFTALSEWDHLEFTIKSYFNTGEDGVTERLFSYVPGDRLLLRDVWGTITYKGPGTFIAGGAGMLCRGVFGFGALFTLGLALVFTWQASRAKRAN